MDEKEKVILAFLKKMVQRLEKELEIKRWEYSADPEDPEDPIDNKDTGVYTIGNKFLNPSLIVEINIKPEKILVFIYNNNSKLLKIIKEELPKAAKKLKNDDWTIYW